MTFDNSNVYYIGKRRAVQNDKETLKSKSNVYLEELIISYGGGSNGKSTFWNSIAGALGGYSGNISADTLRQHRTEIARQISSIIFCQIDKIDAGILTYFKEILAKMTENLPKDGVQSLQAVFVRCCLNFLNLTLYGR